MNLKGKNNVNLKDSFINLTQGLLYTDEFKRIDDFIQHGRTSCFWHSVAVAYYSLHMINYFNIKCDARSLVRGALLHDYFLYDWHDGADWHNWHGFKHPNIAFNNAKRDFEINDIEKNIIKRHMFPLTITPPRYVESIVVCLIDKICIIYETFKRKNTYVKLKAIFNLT